PAVAAATSGGGRLVLAARLLAELARRLLGARALLAALRRAARLGGVAAALRTLATTALAARLAASATVAIDCRTAAIGRADTVARGEHDLEFVQLVPLGIGALAIGNGLQRLHAGTRGNWFWCVH